LLGEARLVSSGLLSRLGLLVVEAPGEGRAVFVGDEEQVDVEGLG
jgi:hypothetical protein